MSGMVNSPAKPLRTWLPMALWSLGILLVLGLTWFVAAVAVPVWQTRSVVNHLLNEMRSEPEIAADGLPMLVSSWADATQEEYAWIFNAQMVQMAQASSLESLGGPKLAARKLELYFRSPVASEPGRWLAFRLICLCGRDGLPVLAGMANCQSPTMRREAAVALGEIGGREAIGPLLRALQDGSPEVRGAAVFALGRTSGDACLPELEAMMSDADKDVRLAAIRAFGYAGRERAIDGLSAVFQESQDLDACIQAGCALREIGPAAEDALIAGLKAQSSDARMVAAAALGKLGGAKAKAALVAASKMNGDPAGYYVLRALSRIQSAEAREQALSLTR